MMRCDVVLVLDVFSFFVFLVLLNSKLVLANAVACVFHMKLFDSNMSLMTTFDTCVNISIISVILYYLYQSLVRDDQVTV